MFEIATGDRAALDHRVQGKVTVRQQVEVPILHGSISGTFYTFHNLADGKEHLAIRLGPPHQGPPPLVRLHSECLTGDVFSSQRCDCGTQLREALYRLHSEGGYLIYLRQEGRGIGLYAKLDAYHLQNQGFDTFGANRHLNYEEDARDYGCAADMLRALGVTTIRLLSNNLNKVTQLESYGIRVHERLNTGLYLTPYNRRYLLAKGQHTNYHLNLPDRRYSTLEELP